MIKYPNYDNRNLTTGAKEKEKHHIDMLNEVLKDVELTKAEEQSLLWLCGWETSTIRNIISAFKKSKG